MAYLQYMFSSTLKKEIDEKTVEDYFTTQTGTNIFSDMGVWGRVVLDENGNMCEEGTDVRLKNRIYNYRLSATI